MILATMFDRLQVEKCYGGYGAFVSLSMCNINELACHCINCTLLDQIICYMNFNGNITAVYVLSHQNSEL